MKSVGNLLRRFLGLIEKEYTTEMSSRLYIINRLLVGPAIGLATTGILYAGIFKFHPTLKVANMHRENFVPFIAFGFLSHTYLNAGYYVLSNKLLGEWWGRTLPLIWLAPCHRTMVLLSLCSLELLRCSIVSVLVFCVLTIVSDVSWSVLPAILFLLLSTFTMAVAIGFVRAGLSILHPGKAELADNFYLIFVFTACPYIPKSILPKFIQPVSQLNPAYHACDLMRSLWVGHPTEASQWLVLLVGWATIWLVVSLTWTRYQRPFLEQCLP